MQAIYPFDELEQTMHGALVEYIQDSPESQILLAGLLEAVFKYGAVYGYQDGKHDCKEKGMKQLG